MLSANNLSHMMIKQRTYSPKSAGRLLNDISLSPNVVRLCSCENPDGNLKQ